MVANRITFSAAGIRFISMAGFLLIISVGSAGQGLRNTRMDGYRGIWFELNQKYEYGDKYSGGLGTYTAKHRPLAIYAPEVQRTFFVYGGTPSEDERHLLCMAGMFDHITGKVCRPVVAWDKITVNDPHDNPSLSMDPEGYLWILVSGRGTLREGIKLKSHAPYSIDSFRMVSREEFTYPQIWHTGDRFFHFFTRYSGIRELYFETSSDGKKWSEDVKLAGIREPGDSLGGHYQVSALRGEDTLLATFFNRHLNGHPDTRTDLYYLQTPDLGRTWTSATGDTVSLPVEEVGSPCRVIDYSGKGLNVYLKDMVFDRNGNPVCLYLTSSGHEPGPENVPYTWRITCRRKNSWVTFDVCRSDHNYDMGSLFLDGDLWILVAPTGDPPQPWGVGGEIEVWESTDAGVTWKKEKELTRSSPLNHSYIRSVENGQAPFQFFWASGHAHQFSNSELFFGDQEGQLFRLPYRMKKEFEKPARLQDTRKQ